MLASLFRFPKIFALGWLPPTIIVTLQRWRITAEEYAGSSGNLVDSNMMLQDFSGLEWLGAEILPNFTA